MIINVKNPAVYRVVSIILAIALPVSIIAQDEATQPIDRFALVLSAGELTLDPLHSFRTTELQIATGIYEGLVIYDPETLRPRPGVAYRWDISEDGRLYTFHLRERARFSNGEPITAVDFRESWLRIIDPNGVGEYSFFFDVITGAADYRAGIRSDPESVGIRVVDSNTLEVELDEPASHLLSMLCHMTFAPIHSSYRDLDGWDQTAPLITNGPYSLGSWETRGMALERNEFYWDAWNVRFAGIDISFDTTPGRASSGLDSGAIDWSVTADSNLLLDRTVIQVAPLFATSYLYFRADEEPWSDFRVRKGLARFVPWSTIRESTTPFATDHLVPSMGFYPAVEGLTEADVESGLDLLSSAGFPEGAGLPPITILVIPGSIADGAAREAAEAWREHLHIEVEIRGVSFSAYQDEVRRGGFTIGSSTWIGDFADPLAFLQMWTENSNLNDARYADEKYDELVLRAMGEAGEKRFESLSQAERRLLVEEVVVIPLSHTLSVNFIDLDRIGGWYPNALDVHPLKNLFFKTPTIPRWYAEGDSNPAAAVASATGVVWD